MGLENLKETQEISEIWPLPDQRAGYILASQDTVNRSLARLKAFDEEYNDKKIDHEADVVETIIAEPLLSAGEYSESPDDMSGRLKAAHDVGETAARSIINFVEGDAEKELDPHERRVESIFKAIDPENKLPKVHLETDINSAKANELAGKNITRKVAYDDLGNIVGEIQLRGSKYTSGVQEVAYTHANQRGQGYGMAMYLEQIASSVWADEVVASDPVGVSEDAKKIWDKLIDAGVATVRQPFELTNPGEDYPHYSGSAVVRLYADPSKLT